MLSLSLAILAGTWFLASAEPCDPSKQTCPDAIPGLRDTLSVDFTKQTSLSDDWILADYANLTFNNQNGAEFTFTKRYDAPYIWTRNYFLFARVDVEVQAAPGGGLITGAVLMSDNKDELDWEWSGNNFGYDQGLVQTNYFGKGITGNYDRGTQESIHNPTSTFHTYSYDWKPEQVDWLIDGKIIRTVKNDNQTSGEFQYPQTPSRLHLGIWNAGDQDSPAGVVNWAGGHLDLTHAPYSAFIRSVKISPYMPCTSWKFPVNFSGRYQDVNCTNTTVAETTITKGNTYSEYNATTSINQTVGGPVYTVVNGDSCDKISRTMGCSLDVFKAANTHVNCNLLMPGTIVKNPQAIQNKPSVSSAVSVIPVIGSVVPACSTVTSTLTVTAIMSSGSSFACVPTATVTVTASGTGSAATVTMTALCSSASGVTPTANPTETHTSGAKVVDLSSPIASPTLMTSVAAVHGSSPLSLVTVTSTAMNGSVITATTTSAVTAIVQVTVTSIDPKGSIVTILTVSSSALHSDASVSTVPVTSTVTLTNQQGSTVTSTVVSSAPVTMEPVVSTVYSTDKQGSKIVSTITAVTTATIASTITSTEPCQICSTFISDGVISLSCTQSMNTTILTTTLTTEIPMSTSIMAVTTTPVPTAPFLTTQIVPCTSCGLGGVTTITSTCSTFTSLRTLIVPCPKCQHTDVTTSILTSVVTLTTGPPLPLITNVTPVAALTTNDAITTTSPTTDPICSSPMTTCTTGTSSTTSCTFGQTQSCSTVPLITSSCDKSLCVSTPPFKTCTSPMTTCAGVMTIGTSCSSGQTSTCATVLSLVTTCGGDICVPTPTTTSIFITPTDSFTTTTSRVTTSRTTTTISSCTSPGTTCSLTISTGTSCAAGQVTGCAMTTSSSTTCASTICSTPGTTTSSNPTSSSSSTTSSSITTTTTTSTSFTLPTTSSSSMVPSTTSATSTSSSKTGTTFSTTSSETSSSISTSASTTSMSTTTSFTTTRSSTTTTPSTTTSETTTSSPPSTKSQSTTTTAPPPSTTSKTTTTTTTTSPSTTSTTTTTTGVTTPPPPPPSKPQPPPTQPPTTSASPPPPSCTPDACFKNMFNEKYIDLAHKEAGSFCSDRNRAIPIWLTACNGNRASMTSAFACITASATPVVNRYNPSGGQCYQFGGQQMYGQGGNTHQQGRGRKRSVGTERETVTDQPASPSSSRDGRGKVFQGY